MNVNYAIAIIGIVILLAKVADSQDFFFFCNMLSYCCMYVEYDESIIQYHFEYGLYLVHCQYHWLIHL